MAKYRLLTGSELKEFEREFINYLAINGITAGDWVTLSKDQPGKATEITAMFSDVVFEKLLRQTQYLFAIRGKIIFSFNYGRQKATLFMAEYSGEADLKNYEKIELLNFIRQHAELIDISVQTREYEQSREQEIFAMMEAGCIFDDLGLHKLLYSMLENNSSQ